MLDWLHYFLIFAYLFTICTVKKRRRYVNTDRQTRAILMPPDCLHEGAMKSINGDENKIMATFLFIGYV